MPEKGQEKSDVERSVFALERRACTPVPRAKDLIDLNRHLLAFCMKERERTVAHQRRPIGENFEHERAVAMGLPIHPFDACISRSVIVDKYQCVMFETNRYSVPHVAAFATVTAKAYVDRIAVVHRGLVVAEHVRRYDRHGTSLKPEHFVLALARKPAWLDHVPAMRDWALPPSFERLRQTLQAQHGIKLGDRHYIRVLQLLIRHPAARIDQAIERSLHKPALTAEAITQAVEKLAAASEGASLDSADNDPTREADGLARRVQVPMPDLRRFDQLLGTPTQQTGDLAS